MKIFDPKLTGSIEILNTISGNVTIAGGLNVEGSLGGAVTGSATASYIEYSNVANKPSLISSSAQLIGQTIDGDLTVGGVLTAQEFHTEFVSASIIYQSGSTQFGNSTDDTHIFTGTGSFDKLGIGTSTPTSKLTVIGNARIDNSSVGDSLIFFGDNPDWYLAYQQSTSHSYWRVSGDHFIEGASGYKGKWDANGNLGIGQVNPIFKLDVTGEVRSTNQITVDSATAFTLRGAGSDTYTVSTIYADSSVASWEAPLTSNSSGASPVPFILSWRGGFASKGGLRLGGSTALYTNDTGLGIGEDTPGHKLDIKGSDAYLVNINNTGGEDARLQFERGGVAYGHMSAGADLFTMYGNTGTSLRFMPGGSTAMFIQASDGNVGIGTTSPSQKLHVNGVDASFGSSAMRLFINRTGTNVGSLIFTTGGPATSNGWAEIGQTDADGDLYFKANPSAASYSTRMVIKGSTGYIGIGTTLPDTPFHVRGSLNGVNELVQLTNAFSGGVTQLGFQQNDVDGLHHRAYLRAKKDPNGEVGGQLGILVRAVGGAQYEAMTIRSNGDVGIGTDGPSKRLTVRYDQNGSPTILKIENKDGNSNAGAFIGFSTGYDGQAAIGARREGAENDSTLVFSPMLNEVATERMTIDSLGRVLKPSTPAFLATKFTSPPAAFPGGTTKQTYTTVKYNIGSHYNGTDRFTAPVAGRYVFTVQKALNTLGPDKTIRHPGLELRVNGTSYVDQNVGQSSGADIGPSEYTHFTSTLSTVVNLAANDYVEVYFVYSGSPATHYEYGTEFFMGYLLG